MHRGGCRVALAYSEWTVIRCRCNHEIRGHDGGHSLS
jgi:hypothetical protein